MSVPNFFSMSTPDSKLTHCARRHFSFLADTFPDLTGRTDEATDAAGEKAKKADGGLAVKHPPTPLKFLRQVLGRVAGARWEACA